MKDSINGLLRVHAGTPIVDRLAKALEGDEAVQSGFAGTPQETREPACGKCGRVFKNPGGFIRHQMATGHGTDRPDRDDSNDYAHGDDLAKAKANAQALLRKIVAYGKRECTVCGEVLDGEAAIERHRATTRHFSHGPVYE